MKTTISKKLVREVLGYYLEPQTVEKIMSAIDRKQEKAFDEMIDRLKKKRS